MFLYSSHCAGCACGVVVVLKRGTLWVKKWVCDFSLDKRAVGVYATFMDNKQRQEIQSSINAGLKRIAKYKKDVRELMGELFPDDIAKPVDYSILKLFHEPNNPN